MKKYLIDIIIFGLCISLFWLWFNCKFRVLRKVGLFHVSIKKQRKANELSNSPWAYHLNHLMCVKIIVFASEWIKENFSKQKLPRIKCSKLTTKTQNDVIVVILLSLLLTLSMFYIFCSVCIVEFKHVFSGFQMLADICLFDDVSTCGLHGAI